jgi:hypothetical protein
MFSPFFLVYFVLEYTFIFHNGQVIKKNELRVVSNEIFLQMKLFKNFNRTIPDQIFHFLEQFQCPKPQKKQHIQTDLNGHSFRYKQKISRLNAIQTKRKFETEREMSVNEQQYNCANFQLYKWFIQSNFIIWSAF